MTSALNYQLARQKSDFTEGWLWTSEWPGRGLQALHYQAVSSSGDMPDGKPTASSGPEFLLEVPLDHYWWRLISH